MNSNERIALAVGATTGIAVIALLAVLRSDSAMRRRSGRPAWPTSVRYQLDTWDNEGGSLPDEAAADVPEADTGRNA